MSNDTSVFPVALLENAATGPITYQGEEVRRSPTYANNSANAIKNDGYVRLTGVKRGLFLVGCSI